MSESNLVSEINLYIRKFGYNREKMLLKIINELKKYSETENKIRLLKNEINNLDH